MVDQVRQVFPVRRALLVRLALLASLVAAAPLATQASPARKATSVMQDPSEVRVHQVPRVPLVQVDRLDPEGRLDCQVQLVA